MKADRVRWMSVLAAWVRNVFATRPPDWADYAATKDWETAEYLWRKEKERSR